MRENHVTVQVRTEESPNYFLKYVLVLYKNILDFIIIILFQINARYGTLHFNIFVCLKLKYYFDLIKFQKVSSL